MILRRFDAATWRPDRSGNSFTPEQRARLHAILDGVRERGEAGVREYAERLDGLRPTDPLRLARPELERALARVPRETLELLERTARRIERFAKEQRAALRDVEVAVPGGRAGHRVQPLERAGCYAPGGRYPLPSSVLMTVVPARVAGVSHVVVATPSRAPVMLAAAALAGADEVLCAGGAQAVAALAYGTELAPAVDLVCGPGNRWVTEAKRAVFGRVKIDMLAGPSELCVLADETACARRVALDLCAQAEHDPEATPVLVTTSPELPDEVERALEGELATLPTADVARAALAGHGACVVAADLETALAAVDRLAPEHLALDVRDPEYVAARVRNFGAVFLGTRTAEVLGDYGLGPNHCLPTGGAARFGGGLSVLDFLAVRTWSRIDRVIEASELVRDASALARLEGLEAHARSADSRLDY